MQPWIAESAALMRISKARNRSVGLKQLSRKLRAFAEQTRDLVRKRVQSRDNAWNGRELDSLQHETEEVKAALNSSDDSDEGFFICDAETADRGRGHDEVRQRLCCGGITQRFPATGGRRRLQHAIERLLRT